MKIFIFPIVKIVANYAKIDGVGSLDGVFNKFHLLKISEFFAILLWNIIT